MLRTGVGLDKAPFFILGCVRSGTTMLRNILRKHPELASPEETHFFRWSEPHASQISINQLRNSPILKKHRELDGVSEEEFEQVMLSSLSRADLCKNYMSVFLRNSEQTGKRWFDKTPQNIFCGALLFSQFPDSKLIHIVRNPLDVVCSLRVGKVMQLDSVLGACNYWVESVQVFDTLKKADDTRVYEVRYEDFADNTKSETSKLLAFIGEKYYDDLLDSITVKTSSHDYREMLSDEEVGMVKSVCSQWMEYYNFQF